MIFLDDTTTTLEIDLTSAVTTNQLPFVASYVDISTAAATLGAITGAASQTGTSNSTTVVTAVAAPGATTTRQIKYFSWKNSDTVATEGWVQLNENGPLKEIWKGTLAVGDTLVYMDGAGWSVINSSGAIKTSFANTFTATRVPFAGADGILTTDSGFTFNTTGDILTVGAINVAGTTAPTSGWYLPSAGLIRTPNSVTIDNNLTVSGTGTSTISGPLVISGASAGQIVFPATQNPTADANTLDDYEEGPWTPGISFGGGTTGITYGADGQIGFYTKIGNLVTVTGYIGLSNKGSSAGAALITGLPFSVAATSAGYSPPSLRLNAITFANQHQHYCNVGTTTIVLGEVTEAGATSTLDDTNFANTSEIFISATYRVAT